MATQILLTLKKCFYRLCERINGAFKRTRVQTAITFITSLTVFSSAAIAADMSSDFYKGKVVNIVVGAAAGTGYDISARVLADHISHHIPGNPTIVVQNMPAAGSLAAANWLYNSAPNDGATFGSINNILPVQPLLATNEQEKSRYRFDALKLKWVGSIENDPQIGFCRKGAPVKTFEDAFKKTAIVAGSTPQSNSVILPTVLNNLIGTKFNIIPGYQNVKAPFLAIERGEADCNFTLYGTIRAVNPQWTASKESPVNFLIVLSLQKPDALKNVPLIFEYAKTEDQKNALKLLLVPLAMGRPFVAPPKVVPERLNILRQAFQATMQDPNFLAEMEKTGANVSPMTGEGITQLMTELYSTSTHTIDVLKKAMPTMGSK